jgi:hypothetical protein
MRQNGKSKPRDAGTFDSKKPGSTMDLSAIDPYADSWHIEYTDGWDDTNETRDCFERVVAALHEAYP